MEPVRENSVLKNGVLSVPTPPVPRSPGAVCHLPARSTCPDGFVAEFADRDRGREMRRSLAHDAHKACPETAPVRGRGTSPTARAYTDSKYVMRMKRGAGGSASAWIPSRRLRRLRRRVGPRRRTGAGAPQHTVAATAAAVAAVLFGGARACTGRRPADRGCAAGQWPAGAPPLVQHAAARSKPRAPSRRDGRRLPSTTPLQTMQADMPPTSGAPASEGAKLGAVV